MYANARLHEALRLGSGCFGQYDSMYRMASGEKTCSPQLGAFVEMHIFRQISLAAYDSGGIANNETDAFAPARRTSTNPVCPARANPTVLTIRGSSTSLCLHKSSVYPSHK